MATRSHTNHASHLVGDTLHNAYALGTNLFGELLIAGEKAKTRHSLNKLSSRQLEDIGLSRADISSEVDKAFKNRS